MALIKSISGFRGTIGGPKGDNLTPIDIVESAAAFGQWVKQSSGKNKIVIGRDARISGPMLTQLVSHTLIALGMDVVDLGLSTTPTVEMAVPEENAGGGIILTASHNPKEWNALKLLNEKGEFISGEEGQKVLEMSQKLDFNFASVDQLGSYREDESYLDKHIAHILNLPIVHDSAIAQRKLRIVVDSVNSTGAVAVPALLGKLGCETILINGEMNGHFAHNPEPLPQHLDQLAKTVKAENADLGIAVDPDVDRLAFVSEDGSIFGEEYTLVAVADYVLQNKKGPTVSNLSSSRSLRDVTEKHGQQYFASAVGEVNVVNQMKATEAVIGGEGNGGIIYPELHYGRDALVGIALFLSFMAKEGKKASEIRASYPDYTIMKNKIQLTPEINIEALLKGFSETYKDFPQNTIDGLKIDFPDSWLHLRKSNTEPIIRVYTEASSAEKANELAKQAQETAERILNK